MRRFTGVLVLFALACQCAYGQPTYDASVFDDFFQWRDGRELLEQMVMYFQRVILHQQQQQWVQDERMQMLEQMLNESLEGQRRLETHVSELQRQQLENQMNRYASLQHHQQQQLSINSLINNVTAKLEAVSDDVNAIKASVDTIKQQPSDESISHTLMTEFRNLSVHLADEQQSYDQKRHNQSVEQLKIITASIAPIRQGMSQIIETMEETVITKMQNAVGLCRELSDLVANVSQKLTENEERYAELCRHQIGSMIQLGSVSLGELRDVARQISAQQLQQQARDDVLLGKMMDLADNTAQSQLSLLAKYEQIQASVSENISQLLGALTALKQEQSQIVEFVTTDFYQQVRLLEGVAIDSSELIANNLSMQLTGIAESCMGVGSGFGEAIQAQAQLHSELLEVYQEAIVNNITDLLEAVRTEVGKRSEETSEAITMAVENITTHLSEIQDKTEDISEDLFTHDLIFSGKVTEILSNVTQSQQQLFAEVGREMDRKMNESLIVSNQSHVELVGHITDTSGEIRIQLARVQEEVRMYNERELLSNSGDNITLMLANIEGACASVASSVNAAEEILAQELQEQRRIVLANARLLGAVNQTCATATAQSLQQHNNALNNISAQLATITDMLPRYGK